MYLAVVMILMVLAPLASLAYEAAVAHGGWVFLAGKWFVFWAVGVRLLIAAARQIAKPEFTARDIFEIEDAKALVIVQELGFANFALGLIAVLSLRFPAWIAPAAVAGAVFYALAGALHWKKGERNRNENIAMFSDFWIAAVLAGCLLGARW